MMPALQIVAIALAATVIGSLAFDVDRNDLDRGLAAACAAFLILAVLFGPSAFLDFDVYMQYAESLRQTDFADLVAPEFFSRALLKLLPIASGSPETGVALMAWGIFVSTFTGIALLSRSYSPCPANVATLLALFGPLLVFNTLRASPAYLLVAFVILRGPRWDWASACGLLLALGFHVSALLPTAALALFALLRWTLGDRPGRNAWAFGVLVALAIAGQLALRSRLGEVLQMFSEGSDLARLPALTAYLDEALFSRSVLHDIWYLAVAAVGVVLFYADRGLPEFKRRQLFVAFFVVFAVLEASPNAAERFSSFFLIPLILGTDHQKLIPSLTTSRAFRFGFPIAAGALFVATFLLNLNLATRSNLLGRP
jgi:hypothetical protein